MICLEGPERMAAASRTLVAVDQQLHTDFHATIGQVNVLNSSPVRQAALKRKETSASIKEY